LIIGKEHEGTVIEEIFDKRAEQLDVAASECATGYEVDDFAQPSLLAAEICSDKSPAGSKTSLSRSRIAPSAFTVSPTALMSLIMRLARK
jgi:hypothetical protein